MLVLSQQPEIHLTLSVTVAVCSWGMDMMKVKNSVRVNEVLQLTCIDSEQVVSSVYDSSSF